MASFEEMRNKLNKPLSLKGQQDLFGESEIKKSMSQTVSFYQNIEEFREDELQNLERQLLGFSLSAKPVVEIIGDLENQATHKIHEIASYLTLGEQIRIAAIVTEVRVIITKNGSEMAFVKVDDGTGVLDLIVFPKIYRLTRDYWVDYKPLLICGKLDAKDEEPILIVDTISTKEDHNNKNEELFIKIPKNINKNQLLNLRALLANNPGSQTVVLVFEKSFKKMKLPIKISWSETLAKQIAIVLEDKDKLGVK